MTGRRSWLSYIFKKLNNLFLFYHSLQGDKKERIQKCIPFPISNPSSLCYNIINMIQYGYQRLISAQVEVSASDCQKLFFPCKADRGTGRLSKDDVMKQKRSPARDASLRRSKITHRGKLYFKKRRIPWQG